MEYITSESQLIDLQAISVGCSKITSAGESFEKCAREVESASDACSIEVLSVDNKTLQPIMLELADQIRSLKSELEGLSKSIQSVAQDIYNQQYAQLQEYRKSLQNSTSTGNGE